MAGLGSAIGRRLGGFAGSARGYAGKYAGQGVEKLGLGHIGSELSGGFRGSIRQGYKMFGGSRGINSRMGTALGSMRNHAIAGAVIGGANSYRRGDSVMDGAARGAAIGGAIGGARMGYKAMNRIQGSGLYSRMVSDAKLMPKDWWKRR